MATSPTLAAAVVSLVQQTQQLAVAAQAFGGGLVDATGATKVGTPEGSVQAALTARVKTADLAAASGATKVGYQRGSAAILRAINSKLDALLTFDEYMTDAELVDSRASTPSLDITASLQKAVDNNKGYRIVGAAGRAYHANGLILEGSTYNGTELVFQGKLLQRQRPSTSTSNFGGAYSAILLRDCEGVGLTLLGDQQRLVQPDEEHIYLVGLAGVRRLRLDVRAINLRGDAVYCSQYDWTNSSSNTSANTDGVTGRVWAWNPTPDGRNILSHISGDNVALDEIISFNVGGFVGGVWQPGGYDMEPNHTGNSCLHTSIGKVHVVTSGTSGLAIAGRVGSAVSRTISIGSAIVINTCSPNVNDAAGNLTQTDKHTLLINSAQGVKIKSYVGKFTNAYGDAIIIADSSGVELDATVSHVRVGARCGGDVKDATGGGAGVTNSDITIKVSDFSRFGVQTGKTSSTEYKGKVTGPVAGMYAGGIQGVISMSNPSVQFTQKDVKYSIDVPADAILSRSYRNDVSYPALFDNVVQCNSDRSGTTWGSWEARVGDMKVPRINVTGVTDLATIPTIGTNLWVDGQRFVNTSPGGLDVPLGWRYDATANLMRPILANTFRRLISRNYALTENFDAGLYDIFSLNIQANGALTYNAPTNGTVGQELTIRVRNVSGGAMGVITWNAVFKMSGWTNPATAKSRSVTFYFDGTNWIEISQTLADVAN